MGNETTILDHEGRLSVVETQVRAVKKAIGENTTLTQAGFDKITNLLQGDNGEGLTTKVALIKQSNNRLWKFVGAISIAVALATVTKVFGG